jgi:hypothetical protein
MTKMAITAKLTVRTPCVVGVKGSWEGLKYYLFLRAMA